MLRSRRRRAFAVVAGLAASAAVFTAVAIAVGTAGPSLTSVPTANTRSAGYAPASILSPELRQIVVAQGSNKLENPNAADKVAYYGYDSDTVNAAGEPQMVPTAAAPATEAAKTEPDKNVYLVFRKGLPGADPAYDYGTHFLFQGHETGTIGYVTRINLDADGKHRVTLLGTRDKFGAAMPTIDGITWDPWASKLLLTDEKGGLAGGVWAANVDAVPASIEKVNALGSAAYEGIQDDSDGNLYLAEDASGSNKPAVPGPGNTTAKVPNSFIYRYVPEKKGDLQHGKLQVLQVLNSANQPITRASQTALNSPDQVALHVYGSTFKTKWVTVHDTAVDGTAAFDANVAATAKNGTPFKRPENGQFRPGSHFGEFYFDETGDTNSTSPENPTAGGWGSIFKLTQSGPSADTGQLSIFYNGDSAHAGFDNVAFLSKDAVSFVEDAGDTLHGQRNALDSGWVFDVRADYSNASNQPIRWLAEGRDASATLDASASPTGFGKNEGDNEITGIHVSDGDPGPDGILGARNPNLDDKRWRWFYTQQHGDNPTYEVVSANSGGNDDQDD
jgi:hypothetical protein